MDIILPFLFLCYNLACSWIAAWGLELQSLGSLDFPGTNPQLLLYVLLPLAERPAFDVEPGHTMTCTKEIILKLK